VAPREATPTKGLWLSPIDLAATACHIPLVFFYSSGAAFSSVARLKEAMARALVALYPLAGSLGVDEDGRLEISCNGEGALFVVSRSCPETEPAILTRGPNKYNHIFLVF
jgi:shikimate O-hydroxycinnamoyltransferase